VKLLYNNFTTKVVFVTLSQRNLESLQAAMVAGDPGPTILRTQEDGTLLCVRLESNEDHYKSRKEE
jgi:hypothetical protein